MYDLIRSIFIRVDDKEMLKRTSKVRCDFNGKSQSCSKLNCIDMRNGRAERQPL